MAGKWSPETGAKKICSRRAGESTHELRWRTVLLLTGEDKLELSIVGWTFWPARRDLKPGTRKHRAGAFLRSASASPNLFFLFLF